MVEKVELDRLTAASEVLVRRHRSGKLICVACAHRCALAHGRRGVCRVRVRDGESLRVPWGYTAGVAVDPIEKKPFFHVVPGSGALSFGMLGCDMKCSYCQNWFTSQTLRDPKSSTWAHRIDPEELVRMAVENGCRSVISTYNEPLITAEWAHEVFTRARRRGLLTGCVSNGHATPEVIDYLQPVTDIFKVDLKAFEEATYRALGGKLSAVADSIGRLWRRGVWVEVVTLVVPGLNDDRGELSAMASFLADVSPDLVWHVTAFHPDYGMTDRPSTPKSTLESAAHIGREAGLQHVYVGNVPGAVAGGEDTRCPGCGETVVRRLGFAVLECRLSGEGRCPVCNDVVAGCWSSRTGG